MKNSFDLVGRILIGIVSLFEALDSIVFYEANKATLEVYNILFLPNIIMIGTITVLIIGGLMVLVGYSSRLGSFLLLLYWLPYTFIVYSFWNDAPEIQRVQALMFLRMMAYCGGLFILLANGAGDWSVKRLFHTMRLPG